MSLNAILEAIRAAGEADVQAIERQAQTKAREILAEARLAADLAEEQACAKALAPAFPERARIVHKARLEALRITGGARETLVDAALERTRGRLAGMRNDVSYPQVLRRLLEEALVEIAETLRDEQSGVSIGNAVLEADPRDRVLLEKIQTSLGLELPTLYNLDCWGGLVVKSEDSRVVVINTLEARLERATPYLRHYLAALFEEHRPEARVPEYREEAVSHIG